MNILVVNNESIHTQELVVACRHNGRNEVNSIYWHELSACDLSKYDVLVLSGSSIYSVRARKQIYALQKKLILEAQIPIIGICAGFELICDAYGITPQKSDKKISGIFPLTPIANDEIFEVNREYMVYEKHSFVVKNVKYPLIPLAFTGGNIAVIKHESKPIYGMQFHPEVRRQGSNGLLILHAVLKQILSSKNTP